MFAAKVFLEGGLRDKRGTPVAGGRRQAGGGEAIAVGREGIRRGVGFGVVVIGGHRQTVCNRWRRRGGRRRHAGRFGGGRGGRGHGQGRGQAFQEGGIISVILELATCREEDEVELILRIFVHKLRDK
jgi:hypothetical protein